MEIVANNVNGVLAECLHYLRAAGVEEDSRNGKVLVSPEPLLVTYRRPTEHVLFSPLRDANPFFHMMEALWMLAGRNDLAWPAYFAKNIANYSDNGVTLYGAYGERWRKYFGYDQLKYIVTELKRNPASRRCVLGMWDATGNCDTDPQGDLGRALRGGLDVPCNTHAYFDCRGGRLNVTVCNRSNDLLWGLAGANAVHFSVLLEYMAAWVGVPVGEYRQFTNNLHVYPASLPRSNADLHTQLFALATDAEAHDYYAQSKVMPFPLVNTDIATWDRDLGKFFATPTRSERDYEDVFFKDVVAPMYTAWHARKEQGLSGEGFARLIAAPDWRVACTEWITRHAARKAAQRA